MQDSGDGNDVVVGDGYGDDDAVVGDGNDVVVGDGYCDDDAVVGDGNDDVVGDGDGVDQRSRPPCSS